MGAITKIPIRNMKRRKIRYILTTITLVIGVALFGGVLIVSDSFNVMLINSIDKQMGTADILIRASDTEDGWFDADSIEDKISSIDHFEAITFRISGFNVHVSAVDGGDKTQNSTSSSVYGIDHENEDEIDLGGTPYILDTISNEVTLEELLDHEDGTTGSRVLVITESLKIKLGKDFEAGDHVRVLPIDATFPISEYDTSTWLKYTVVAIIRDMGEAKDFDTEKPTDVSTPSQRPCLFTGIQNAHELVDGTEDHSDEYNLAAINIDDIYNVEAAVDDIEGKLEDLKDEKDWVVSDLKTSRLERITETTETMRAMFLMFGLIALILSIILIMNIFNIIKEEQEYETGMFRAIGASKTETFKMFLTQGVIMGALGSVLGTICSYFISFLIFSVTVDALKNISQNTGMMSFTTEFEIILYPSTLILTFSVGLISCIVASLYPSWKASRKPIIDCLNPIKEKTEREKMKYKKHIFGLALASFLILSGVFLLYTQLAPSEANVGPRDAMGDSSVIAMVAPTMVLLGIILITAVLLQPIVKVFIALFGPYLKETKLLTRKNVLRHRRRTILTYSMIALTVSYLVGISLVMESIKEGINTTVYDFMGCDVRVVSYLSPLSFEDELIAQPGVDDVMGVSHQNAKMFLDGEWIGHSQLDEEWDTTIHVNVIQKEKFLKHLKETVITSPADASLEDVMDELDSGNNILITEELAEDYDLKVGDKIEVKFSLGITYANMSAFMSDPFNAIEDTVIIEMEVVGIAKKVQGFSSIDFLGFETGKNYDFFITWKIYEEIAYNNLPGGTIDIGLKQATQTGSTYLDLFQPNWFNFSMVKDDLSITNGIEYYTTRMDYFTTVSNGSVTNLVPQTSVIGLHTNSSQNLKSDDDFGQHIIVEERVGMNNSTMEGILNTTEDICVVTQAFVDSQKSNGDLSFGIGSNVSIYPFQTNPTPVIVDTGSLNALLDISSLNGTLISGSTANLITSDNINMTLLSNNQNLTFNLVINMSSLLHMSPTLFNISLETRINATIDRLEVEMLNNFTNNFDKIENITQTEEYNYSFSLNPIGQYINPLNGLIYLRFSGYNSTATSNYSLSIDNLDFVIFQNVHSLFNTISWPKLQVAGIIETPTLHNAERYLWPFGSTDIGYDAVGNAIISNFHEAIYINYNQARNSVYLDFKGNNITNDKVTSVLMHCSNVKNIETSYGLLVFNLPPFPDYWSLMDFKSFQYLLRTMVPDWFIWIEEGYTDEEVLEIVVGFLEDNGYVVMFAFSHSFVTATFRQMIDLMGFVTNGMLLFAIMIAMIGLSLHCLLSTMARRREIGMLRSIGMSKENIIKTISGETLIVAFLGTIIGIFAGLLQGFLIVSAIPSEGFLTVTWTIPVITIIILILITLATAIISSRFPAKWAANINIIEAIRTR